ncbi:MAG: hypothetical protein ACKVU4_13870 [Phycisphaerales bacterium]
MSSVRTAVFGLAAAALVGGCGSIGFTHANSSARGRAYPTMMAGDGLGRAVFAEETTIAWAPDAPWTGADTGPSATPRSIYARKMPRSNRAPVFYKPGAPSEFTTVTVPTNGSVTDDR